MPAGDEAAVDDIAATADGVVTMAYSEHLWDSASMLGLVPASIGHVNFVFANDLVTPEDFTDEVAGSVMEKITVESTFNSNWAKNQYAHVCLFL